MWRPSKSVVHWYDCLINENDSVSSTKQSSARQCWLALAYEGCPKSFVSHIKKQYNNSDKFKFIFLHNRCKLQWHCWMMLILDGVSSTFQLSRQHKTIFKYCFQLKYLRAYDTIHRLFSYIFYAVHSALWSSSMIKTHRRLTIRGDRCGRWLCLYHGRRQRRRVDRLLSWQMLCLVWWAAGRLVHAGRCTMLLVITPSHCSLLHRTIRWSNWRSITNRNLRISWRILVYFLVIWSAKFYQLQTSTVRVNTLTCRHELHDIISSLHAYSSHTIH